MGRLSAVVLLMMFVSLCTAFAQAPAPFSQLDPKPYDPETDPDIDLYFGNWKQSMPRHSHGSLVERDILTKGDPLKPHRRSAVLKYMNRFAHATLEAHASTTPTKPAGEQEVFYILSGNGSLRGGGKTYDLYSGVSFLIPEGLEFMMSNTGDEPLTMYLVAEPVPKGFKPNNYIVVHDERTTPIHGSNGHWCHINKRLIVPAEGLAEIQLNLTVRIAPNTFAQPHSHREGVEEVWCTIEGNPKVLLGKQIRDLPPGTAYIIPPNGNTPHSNFNVTGDMVKLFYFARYYDHNPREEVDWERAR